MINKFDYAITFNNLTQNEKEKLLKDYLDYVNLLKNIPDEKLEELDLELKHLFL